MKFKEPIMMPDSSGGMLRPYKTDGPDNTPVEEPLVTIEPEEKPKEEPKPPE